MKKITNYELRISNYRTLCLCILIVFGLSSIVCLSQDSTSTSSYKNYSIKQDTLITSLLAKYEDYNKKREFTDGYRIQIMYTDVRDEVYRNKGAMYKEFPELPSYVEYEQPYYKLRIGDFKTRLEATYYLQKVVSVYSGAFIVKDKIAIK